MRGTATPTGNHAAEERPAVTTKRSQEPLMSENPNKAQPPVVDRATFEQ
ncbi:hypothetical protein ACIQ6R_27710 [Streptomyces sp. NPDC096048]